MRIFSIIALILMFSITTFATLAESAEHTDFALAERIQSDMDENPLAYPPGLMLLNAENISSSAVFTFSDEAINCARSESCSESLYHRLAAMTGEYENLRIMITTDKGLLDFWRFQPEIKRSASTPRNFKQAVEPVGGQSVFPYNGPLSGIDIAVSPGHGWLWYGSTVGWSTQRGEVNGIIEDMTNARIAALHVIPALEHAGATVFSCRERDFNNEEILIDEGDGQPAYTDGDNWWSGSYSSGYANGEYRAHVATSKDEEEFAAWLPEFPTSDSYAVYVRYTSGANRAPDAHYTIKHAGGDSIVKVDQTQNGSRWLYIGSYRFDAGRSEQGAYLSTYSDAADGGATVIIADAIKFGGGMGTYERGGSVSGQPRWEESARYWTDFVGAPEDIFASDNEDNDVDVTVRPLYANWQGVDAYISLHSNASNGSVRGTGTWHYNGENISYPITEGSVELRKQMQQEVVKALRAERDPDWTDYGLHTANFGELRVLADAPGALMEVAFHDNAEDAFHIRSPIFRDIVARAITKAILNFFEVSAPLYPRRIEDLAVQVTSPGTLRLSWQDTPETTWPGEGQADYYRIYVSNDGYATDNGSITTGDKFYDFDELEFGKTYYFRVAGVNAGGEGFISEPVAANINCDGQPTLLIVNGFERRDRSIQEEDNTREYIVRHADAIKEAGNYYFVSATSKAFASQALNLSTVEMIDWIGGEETQIVGEIDDFISFSDTQRQKLTSFMDAGGALFVTGSEIGWDAFEASGSSEFQQWYNSSLSADYIEDDAEEYGFFGSDGGIFEGLSGNFDDGSHGAYNVDWPDVISALDGAKVCATYGDLTLGSGICRNDDERSLVYLGVPFEGMVGEDLRNQVMQRVLDYLATEGQPVCDEPVDGDVDGDLDMEVEDSDVDEEVIEQAEEEEIEEQASDGHYEFTIGPKGGRFVTDEGLSIDIPYGAVSESVTIIINRLDDFAADGFALAGPAWSFAPKGYSFALPLTVRLPYDEDKSSEGTLEFFWSRPNNEDSFSAISGANLTAGTATGLTDHFSIGFVAYMISATDEDGDEDKDLQEAADADDRQTIATPDKDDDGGCSGTSSFSALILLGLLALLSLRRIYE